MTQLAMGVAALGAGAAVMTAGAAVLRRGRSARRREAHQPPRVPIRRAAHRAGMLADRRMHVR